MTTPPEPPPLPSDRALTAAAPSTWTCIQTWSAHTSWIRAIALSPDGQWLASGGGDRTVKLWHLPSAELRQTLRGHASWVRGLAFSPDGQWVASVSSDRTLRLWQVETGHLQQTWLAHDAWVGAVAFSPDGQWIATGSQDQTVKLWAVGHPEPIRIFTGHTHWVRAIAFSPNGRYLASGGRDHTLRIWQVETGASAPPLQSPHPDILAIAFVGPDNKTLVTTGSQGAITVWKWHQQTCTATWQGHQRQAISAIAVDAIGAQLFTGGNDKTLQQWALPSAQSEPALGHHPGWVWALALSTDSQRLVSGCWGGVIKVWQPTPAASGPA